MQTIKGKPLSVTVAFRLPLSDYKKALALADRRNESRLSPVLRELVQKGLEGNAAGAGADANR